MIIDAMSTLASFNLFEPLAGIWTVSATVRAEVLSSVKLRTTWVSPIVTVTR